MCRLVLNIAGCFSIRYQSNHQRAMHQLCWFFNANLQVPESGLLAVWRGPGAAESDPLLSCACACLCPACVLKPRSFALGSQAWWPTGGQLQPFPLPPWGWEALGLPKAERFWWSFLWVVLSDVAALRWLGVGIVLSLVLLISSIFFIFFYCLALLYFKSLWA